MHKKTVFRLVALAVVCIGVAAALAVSFGGAQSAAAEQQRAQLNKPEVSYVDGTLIPPAVEPVIVLQGSDYNIGYQYAQQIVQIDGLQALQAMQRSLTDEQRSALKASQWYIKKYMPEFIDQFRGMAAGAGAAGIRLTYEEVLANYCDLKTYEGTEPPGSQDDSLPPSGCSGFAAWGSTTKDGKLICAGSSDNEPGKGSAFSISHLLVVFPETGNSYIASVGPRLDIPGGPLACSHPGMNNKGLCYAHHGAGVAGGEQQGYASFGHAAEVLYPLHTLRFADNAKQALDMQLSYPSGARVRGLWADTSGDAFDIECRDPEVVRQAGENGEQGFLYATNNCLTKKITITKDDAWLADAFGWDITYVPHGGWTAMDEDAVRRNLVMWNMLHNYQGHVDLAFVKMMWRFAGRLPDYPSLEAADEGMYANQSQGWDSKICALANMQVGICQPDKGDQGLYFSCTGPAGKLANGQCPGYSFFIPEATHTFYEVQLASDPAAVADAAKSQAMYDLSYANIELRKLTYANAAYAPLKAIFDKASSEWYVARHYQDLAGKSSGNDAVCDYGKALRYFTRCQAHAQQVYEALVPPAQTPSDLGLKKYWGGWGEWTSWLGSH
jgi:hypothetical protein